MKQEATDELLSVKNHGPLCGLVGIVLPSECDLAVVQGDQARIGDGNAVGIACKILEDLFRPPEGTL
jgi:hypothetical protein